MKEKKRKRFQKILEFGFFPISLYPSFPYYVKGYLAMEAVGYKLTRIPRQLFQKPALINSFGKGVIGGINGIKNFSMGTSMTLQSSLSPLQSPSVNSFSTIRYAYYR